MATLARRFTIISLVMVLFALLFAQAVYQNNLERRPYLSGNLFVCAHGSEQICNIQDLEGRLK